MKSLGKWVTRGNTMIYEDYYKEIKDDSGKITDIELTYGDDFNFAYDVMDRFAKEVPDQLALLHKTADGRKTRFSFRDMQVLSNKAANGLRSLGIGRGDSVLLLLKRRYEFWISILALHKLGAVAVPTSHMVSAKDIRERVSLSKAKAVICVNADDICSKVESAISGLLTCQIVVGDVYKDKKSFDQMLESGESSFDRVTTKVTDPMLYYFTSGTNGAPKAVIHDFSYPLAHIFTAKNWHGVRENGLHLTVADSGWAKTAWGKLYGQWFMGAAIMVYDYEQFYAGDMLRLLVEEKVNTFCAPPTIYKYLVLEDLKKYNLENLHYVTTAGESMPKEVSKKFTDMTGLTVREGFGQTETVLQTCTTVDGQQVPGSIGLASPLYRIELVDENNNPVPDGTEGEIVIVPKDGKRPAGVFVGYLCAEDEYKEVWDGGIYHTKDMAIRDKEGHFFFVGRNDDVIKSSGYRIGPSEVEDILMHHPAVFECAVTGYPSKTRGALVKASIVLNKGYEPDNGLAVELQDFVKKNTAIYKYPRLIKFEESLPHNANGKILRSVIRKRDYNK
ncbi:AMP-binding protein [Butyrivibrio sp. AE2015]|uniref:AMP-binding protein n=1 Tax=Butyrivibrio sp. AE2015 TaxID=1280663 RepID=UPI00047D8B4C|nr:AMP-binding protein [Butyrivibrio sp. AE2015]